MIQRVIVQDQVGKTVLNNPLKQPCDENELRAEFTKGKLPILALTIDTVGTALVTVGKTLH